MANALLSNDNIPEDELDLADELSELHTDPELTDLTEEEFDELVDDTIDVYVNGLDEDEADES